MVYLSAFIVPFSSAPYSCLYLQAAVCTGHNEAPDRYFTSGYCNKRQFTYYRCQKGFCAPASIKGAA